MLSYQHAFHAGNLADVQKHAGLWMLLRTLVSAAARVHYLDSHAGRGLYDLGGQEAAKTGEAKLGIEKLLADRANGVELSPPLNQYAKLVADFQRSSTGGQSDGSKQTRTYPGSPAIARRGLRRGDSGTFFELHPTQWQALSQGLGNDKRFDVRQEDGLAGVLTRLPELDAGQLPLVVIDPSYELAHEFAAVADCVGRCIEIRDDALVLVWSPMMGDGRHKPLAEQLVALGASASRFVYGVQDPKAGPGKRMYGSALHLLAGKGFPADLAKKLRRGLKVLDQGLAQWRGELSA